MAHTSTSLHLQLTTQVGWYSVLLQGLVDSNYKFLDFDVGWPGKCHDAFVFECSYLSQKLENGSFFPKITRKINGVDIPVVIVADSAYSLNKNVMKPFPEGTATASQRSFNEHLSRARIHVEHAFGCLKGRWRILMKRNDSRTSNMKYIVTACIVLHNVCENLNLQFIDTPPHSNSCETLEQPQDDDSLQTSLHEVNEGEQIRKAFEIFINNLS
ncbi:protein ANTAGONIST OF LIKE HETEROCHROMATIN PROTEIN 1-like [Tachysurus ichikawai]